MRRDCSAVIQRTIGGNVATYVCTNEGNVLDILPGVYSPDVYTAQLRQLALLNLWTRHAGPRAPEVAREYHRHQAALIAEQRKPANIEAHRMRSMSILAREGGLRFYLAAQADDALRERIRGRERPVRLARMTDIDSGVAVELIPLPDIDSAEALEQWPVLAAETEQNETVHRMLIHEHLAETGLVPPDQITKWLFRDVLDTDLDEPYLGLGSLLLGAQSRGDTRGSNDADGDSESVAPQRRSPVR